jgi:hypothetical protein
MKSQRGMTKKEFEHIQTLCRAWLGQPETGKENRLSILAGGVLSRPIEIEARGFLTFDNARITSAVDCETGICYTQTIRSASGSEIVIDTPFAKASLPGEPDRAQELRPTQLRYQEAMKQLDASAQVTPTSAMAIEDNPIWIAPEDRGPEVPLPSYFLYAHAELIGHSFLETSSPSIRQRRGRFYPDDDYWKYAEIFGNFTDALNDCVEATVKAAYVGADDETLAAEKRFAGLAIQVTELNLHLVAADGRKVRTAVLRIDDYAAKYDDPAERWLYIVTEDQETYDAFFN